MDPSVKFFQMVALEIYRTFVFIQRFVVLNFYIQGQKSRLLNILILHQIFLICFWFYVYFVSHQNIHSHLLKFTKFDNHY